MAIPFVSCATVHTETVIEAPPAAVWAVLTDTQAYKEWNPVLIPIEGKLAQGETLRYQMVEPGKDPVEVKSKVKRIVEEKLLNQSGGVWGILTYDHRWMLEPVDGGTKVTQHEEYRGIGVWFWDYSWVEPAYAEANEKLKQRVLPNEDQDCNVIADCMKFGAFRYVLIALIVAGSRG